MTNTILKESNLGEILLSGSALTQTGLEVLEKYQSYLLNNPLNCGIINQFLKESASHNYDGSLLRTVELINAFISDNPIGWSLSSVCEHLLNTTGKHDILNRSAARKTMEVLEAANGSEDELVKMIRTGALKEVMYCEAIRAIAKQVFNEQGDIIKQNLINNASKTEYGISYPISYTEPFYNESTGEETGMHFEVLGELYLVCEGQKVQKGDWRNVSNTFKTITQLFESNAVCLIGDNDDRIKVYFNESTYFVIENDGSVKKYGINKNSNGSTNHEDTVIAEFKTAEQFRDHNRLVLMATPTIKQNNTAALLESIALTMENYDNVAILNNASIISIGAGEAQNNILVIESGKYLYAKSLSLPVSQAFEVNENALEVCTYLKEKVHVDLTDTYKKSINESIEQISEVQKQVLENREAKQEINDINARIEALTNQFKNDPAKLAVLTSLASQVQDLNS